MNKSLKFIQNNMYSYQTMNDQNIYFYKEAKRKSHLYFEFS